MRRAAVSIPSNIVEGQSRSHATEFRQFLSIARGSAGELDTQFTIAARLGYIADITSADICSAIAEIRRMLRGLMESTDK